MVDSREVVPGTGNRNRNVPVCLLYNGLQSSLVVVRCLQLLRKAIPAFPVEDSFVSGALATAACPDGCLTVRQFEAMTAVVIKFIN